MNIILIGFMGVGKTEVGRKLAERIGYHFLDTDALIEETEGKKISEIFTENGEKYFRDLETEIIKTLEDYDEFVVSTGGGIVLREENVKALKEVGPLILLSSTPEVIYTRLKDEEDRPLIKAQAEDKGAGKKEKIEKILNERNPIYKNVADYEIETSKMTIMQVVEEIINWLGI